jgi:1,4-dihydroxy-2-naphthoate octaprenyltransferase
LLLVGLAAILAAWGYTGGPKPYGYLGLGELFVFTFFGLVATVGTTYVAIEEVPWVAWPAASGVGSLACALLVVNNLRDIATDAAAGKHTLAVRLGDQWTRRLYAALNVGAIVLAFVCAIDRPWSAIAGLAGVVAVTPLRRVRAGATGRELIAVLGATGRVQLAYGALLAVGLAVG